VHSVGAVGLCCAVGHLGDSPLRSGYAMWSGGRCTVHAESHPGRAGGDGTYTARVTGRCGGRRAGE